MHKLMLSAPCSALACVIFLSGCSGNADKEATSQVAAKVGDTEISLHQINYLLARANANPGSEEAAKVLRRQVLDKLIDQELLVQKAVEDKLDRSPDVQMALENARRDVLAEAYLKGAAGTATKPSDSDVRTYYSGHPELFAKRRVFQLTEISFPQSADSKVKAEVTESVESGRSLEDVSKMLQARGVEFAKSDTQRPSEQISLEVLPKLYRIRQGQGIVAGNAQMVTIVFVNSFQDAPVTESIASPRISQFLANQTMNQNVMQLVSSLKSKTQIKYLGDFAETPAAPTKQQ